ncbi:MAG TPA: hypothetical protein VGC64_07810 [Pyrinomonadaceae bacterium]
MLDKNKSARTLMPGLMMMLMLLLVVCGAPLIAQAQRKAEAPVASALSDALVDDDANLDVELYLLAASDASGETGGKLPAQLEPIVRRLRATLPFGSYRLFGTMLNRMKNGGRLSVAGVGAAIISKLNAPAPLFSDYSIGLIKLKTDAAGQSIVELSNFKFGARVPIQMSTTAGAGGTSASTIQYENTGINTEFSMREGEPVVVGTLNVGQAGEAFILVVSAKRTKER